MCRSKSQGGRRCPASGAGHDSHASSTPPTPEQIAQSERDLTAATAAVEGRSWGGPLASILLEPIARQKQAAADGHDPRSWAEEVKLGRQLVHGVLTGRGDSDQEAARKIAELEKAHSNWKATSPYDTTR